MKCNSSRTGPSLNAYIMRTNLYSPLSGVGSSTVVKFSAFLNGRYPPADLGGDITVSYSSPTGTVNSKRKACVFSTCAYLAVDKTFVLPV